MGSTNKTIVGGGSHPAAVPSVPGIRLALSGGGARGFAHVGVLNVFEDAGVPVAEVAGTSMGAVVGAYYALHGSVAGIERFAQSLTVRDAVRYFDAWIPRHSVIRGGRIRELFREWFGDACIEETRIPLTVVATDLASGRSAFLRRGPIADAVLASTALPGILPPVRLDGRYYVDGGVTLQLPVAALHTEAGPTVAVGLPLYGQAVLNSDRPPRLHETLLLSYALGRQQTAEDLRALLPPGGILLLPETGTVQDTLRFFRSAKFVRGGEAAARAALPEIRRALSSGTA